MKFIVQRLKRHYVFGKSVYLNVISIYYRREIVQFVFPRPKRRFPKSARNPARRRSSNKRSVFFIQTKSVSHSCRLRQTGAEMTGRCFQPGQHQPVRMPPVILSQTFAKFSILLAENIRLSPSWRKAPGKYAHWKEQSCLFLPNPDFSGHTLMASV